ncbi:MAG: glutaredoxin family protein [Chloroflexi bacterium]|nr:glutaredoxin family protein [Chloroflexota bacterium]MCC6896093.1 glutaredoxin family protein [Anaerolineae bacterium]
MSLPITMYGAADCDDTAALRQYFHQKGVTFREINIDDDPTAEQFVVFINAGFRSTPTLVLGSGKQKIILTEPTPQEFEGVLEHFQ